MKAMIQALLPENETSRPYTWILLKERSIPWLLAL